MTNLPQHLKNKASICASRWLNNEQAAADSANFMKNVEIPGVDDDITAPNTPWIYYGVCLFLDQHLYNFSANQRPPLGILCGCPFCPYESSLSGRRLWCHRF